MVFCPECGIEIKEDNALYCPQCGCQIENHQEIHDTSNNKEIQLAYFKGNRLQSDVKITSNGIYSCKKSKISIKKTGEVDFYQINNISNIRTSKITGAIKFLYNNTPIILPFNVNKYNKKAKEIFTSEPYSHTMLSEQTIKSVNGAHDGKSILLSLEEEGIKESKSGVFTGWDKGGDFFRYDDINSIGIKKGLILGTIIITIPGKRIKIENVNKNFGDIFVKSARKKIKESKIKSKKLEGSNNISTNPLDEIKKAKDLLDAGAISQKQFNEIRDKYLKKI